MQKNTARRTFLRHSAATLAGSAFTGLPFRLLASPEKTTPLAASASIGEIIDSIKKACGEPIGDTVDTIKSGDPSQRCTGIASTFLATVGVIRQAVAQGANLIITHEPTYYNHLDDTGWLADDPVYAFKRRLLEDNGIVVWRFHDYWHQHEPDGVLHGFLKAVGWLPYLDEKRDFTCLIPETSLKELAAFFKGQLKLHRTFFTGDPSMRFRNVALLPGAWGGTNQIKALRRDDVEVVVVGEINEWETCEWVRDAVAAGLRKGLIVLGHAESEEVGMKYLVEWLQPRVPDIAVIHLPATDPFVPV